jgi:SAM-dependent methyltransferase
MRFPAGSVGVDASRPSLQACRKKNLEVVLGDLNDDLGFRDGTFDVVFCSHILEHVDSPISLLREANRILKGNRIVVVSIPYEKSIANAIGLDGYFRNHPEHIYGFSFNGLGVLLTKTGFSVERT